MQTRTVVYRQATRPRASPQEQRLDLVQRRGLALTGADWRDVLDDGVTTESTSG